MKSGMVCMFLVLFVIVGGMEWKCLWRLRVRYYRV